MVAHKTKYMNLSKPRYLLLVVILFHCICCFGFQSKKRADTPAKSFSQLVSEADTFYFRKDWKNAIAKYKAALNDTSSSPIYNYRLGYASYMIENYEDALKSYKKSFSLNPPPQLKFYMYSQIYNTYDKLNRPEEAMTFFKTAVDNGYSNFYLFESTALFDPVKQTDSYKYIIDKAKKNAFPCLSDPVHASFDFWVGEWDVYPTGINAIVGVSSIIKDDGGCVIIEHFKSLVAPGSGHSINYVNTETNKWEQIYSAANGSTQKYVDGVYKDSALTFTYSTINANGKAGTGRFIFYNQGVNQFRQYQDASFDEGKNYQVLTDFTYKRRQEKVVF